MNYLKIEQISLTCSFKDKDLELSFATQSFKKFKKKVIPCFAAAMIVFMLFCVPDLTVSANEDIFVKNLVIRLSAAALFFIFYIAFGRLKNNYSYLLTVNAMELGFIFFYLMVLSDYSNMNFIIKCMDIIVIITLYFIFPNKWIYAVLTSFALVSSFTVFCICNASRFTQNSSYAAGGVYITLTFALNALNFYRINYYERAQFYNISILKKLINTDTLTGAFTRAKFDEDIKRHIALSKQTGRRFSITIFDIDDFKRINDTYGHIEGDRVLAEIARTVTKNKRPRDILTRWGGEEFVVLFPSTALPAAEKIAERLCFAISSTDFSIGEQVTCSFGVTEFQKGDTAISLLRRADKLMYDAKAAGKNIVASDIS
jgi:two-component system, cell cycle response regulator